MSKTSHPQTPIDLAELSEDTLAIAEAQPTPNNAHAREKNPYRGSGTEDDPYIVEFHHNDPRNPYNFPIARRWLYTAIATISVLAVTLTSAAYTGSAVEVKEEFGASTEVFATGVAVYVLGFAVGPCMWAPLGELYGRRIWFIVTHIGAIAFMAGSAGANSMATLIIFRFITGVFAASPLTNSGGIIADLFPSSERGTGLALFSCAPSIGPPLGPIIGGFISESVGWRWVQGVCALFTFAIFVVGCSLMPETYAPVILSKEAARLSCQTGDVYRSRIQADSGKKSPRQVFAHALKRPWQLLFVEPIIFIISVYLSILYGTLYMFLGAFPIVYQEQRGWGEGIGGLSFIGMMVGMIIGLGYLVAFDVSYRKKGGNQPPEARLPPALVGSVCIPIGMFSFAWTTFPSIHWSASITLSSLFGFGMVLEFVSLLNYIIDAYVIYAASALAATAMMRSFFGTAFPLFTSKMYHGLGVHWASSIPAFLTLVCMPFTFWLIRKGPEIRMKCKYAKEAAKILAELQETD
ncbi:hypothetical protein V2G26_018202 [Clonostachys chloroleuca]